MPKFSLKQFTKRFRGTKGDRKPLLKQNSFSDIRKTSTRVGEKASEYKSKGRRVMNYIPSARTKAPPKPKTKSRTTTKTPTPSKELTPEEALKEKWAPVMKKNLAERRRQNMAKIQATSLYNNAKKTSAMVDPSMAYYMQQAAQEKKAAAEEKRLAEEEARQNRAVQTREQFFG